MGTEEAAAVAVVVDMAGAVTVVLAVRRGERQQSDQRRRTSWISRSTWTSASPSSLMADGKVCCHAPVHLLSGKRENTDSGSTAYSNGCPQRLRCADEPCAGRRKGGAQR